VNDIYPVGLTTEDRCEVNVGWAADG